MSSSYSVIPFGTIHKKDLSSLKAYLAKNGLDYPPNATQGRYATQNEIEEVLRSFSSYKIEFYPVSASETSMPWSQAALTREAPSDSRYTNIEGVSLVVPKLPPDKNTECNFYFSKGDENLNYAVLERLAYQCGPLFCITDGECDAVIFHRKNSGVVVPPSFANDHHIHNSAQGENNG